MLRFFTVAIAMPYCLLASNISFFCDIIFMLLFQMLYFYVEHFMFFLDNSLLYATLIKDSILLSSRKEFYINLFFW